MSFYNKYRPSTFAELDSSAVQKLLRSFLSKKKEDLPHAFLLTGPRGTGKTSTSRILAKLFNCTSPDKNGEPCGKCAICTSIAKGNALDVLEIDAASHTGVDNIRDIKDKIMLTPVQAAWKIYIIDEVHMLSTGAFNALLKTLEEPPAHTAFILATTDPQKVPETIKSRCLLIPFNKPDQKEMLQALQRIVTQEKLTVEPRALALIAEMADGSFRDAAKLLEQASLQSSTITTASISEILSLSDHTVVIRFLQAIEQNNAVAGIICIESLQKNATDIKGFFTAVIRELQKRLVTSVLEKKADTAELKRILDVFHTYYADIRYTNFPELTLQLAVLSVCTPAASQPQTAATPAPSVQVRPTATVANTPSTKPPSPLASEPAASSTPQLSTNECTIETITTNWNHIIEEVKKIHHATAGVLRSAKPKMVTNNTLTLETAYAFHLEKLSEPQAKMAIIQSVKTLFGKTLALEINLGKR